MPYPLFKKIVFASLALYFLMGCYIRTFVPSDNLYPFFDWNLFSIIPNEKDTYVMLLLSYDGKTYDPPLEANGSSFVFQEQGELSDHYMMLSKKFGEDLNRKNKEAADIDRKEFEKIFLGHNVRYEILHIFTNPLEYWHHGYMNGTVLGTFTTRT